MKRRDVVRKLEELGCVLVRHGGSYDWYTNPATKKSPPVPRHNEIHEQLAKSIIRKLSKE
ncbi:MAG TPA: type II toxin-antitoxin system HicA family toxin [Candidatus Acidoferrum sp.]|nr:type II toxin-antitoxin system HicA family toxin [Candidatus Acidoferrum sp.]